MMRRLKKHLSFICLVGTVILVLGIGASAFANDAILDEMRFWIQVRYVDEVEESILAADSIEGLLEALGDPNAAHFTADQFQEFIDGIEMQFSGVGIYIDARPTGVMVLSVIEDTPAQFSGLKAGDLIIQAAGKSLLNSTNEEAAHIIRGPEGSTVHLKILRGDQELDFIVTRRTIHVPTVNFEMLEGQIGYIALNSFAMDSYGLFVAALEELRIQGAQSFIIDVRNNSGGYPTTALHIAGLFVGEKVVMQLQERHGIVYYQGLGHEQLVKEPVVLLVNEFSASASEILAAALKEHQAATLIGTPTYGKGTMQTLFTLSTGDVLKLTVARFTSPLGNDIDKIGVTPHLNTENVDPLEAAQLLLRSRAKPQDNRGHFRLKTLTDEYFVAAALAREHWAAWNEIIQTVPIGALSIADETGSWQEVTSAQLAHPWAFFYPDHKGALLVEKALSDDAVFNITAGRSLVEAEVRIVAASTGKVVDAKVENYTPSWLRVRPQEALVVGEAYWLLVSAIDEVQPLVDIEVIQQSQKMSALVSVELNATQYYVNGNLKLFGGRALYGDAAQEGLQVALHLLRELGYSIAYGKTYNNVGILIIQGGGREFRVVEGEANMYLRIEGTPYQRLVLRNPVFNTGQRTYMHADDMIEIFELLTRWDAVNSKLCLLAR